tara:strand:+ start:228 stop:485 length:258 start_codon:yes stop_codon:yes gene_type:complete
MTQYKDRVAEQKERLAAEAWGKQVKYLHAYNGILEVAYNNGEKHFEETKSGRKWQTGIDYDKDSLVEKFNRFMNDVEIGRDPNGI